jgi:uncharacterized membrane protein
MPEAQQHEANAIAIYESHEQAEEAVRRLQSTGFDMKNLSIVGKDYELQERPIGFVNTGDRMWSWGQLGAFWGAIWGLLFGSAMLVIPGIGHVMFAGWLVAALEGAVLGGAFGALGGALSSIGIPDDTVVEYEAEIRAGKFMLIAHGSEVEVERARRLLEGTATMRLQTYTAPKEHAGHH